MFTLYRRHVRSCQHHSDRFYRRCRCAMWIEGTGPGGYIRRSLKTSSWERAEVLRRELEAPSPGTTLPPAHEPTVREAAGKFYLESVARNLAPASLKKYRAFCELLQRFGDRRCPLLTNFTPESAREFRDGWGVGPSTSSKKPTMPFDTEEMDRILQHAGENLTFALVLRHTGLRISDAAMLKTSEFDGQRILLHMQKTGTPVSVPVPPMLCKLLGETEPKGGYYFLRGQSTALDNWTDLWRRQLAKVFAKAGIVNGHPHRFRDTFAVDLLQKGVSLEEVSKLLGHASIRITERHYAPWVQARQSKLEEAVKRTWEEPKLRLVKG
ncbi:MAG: tyrosine-type recombinase/integrase [Bryobacterales bacterium]|nr:tyrosine-type recombinase/integrase [Bryobacterales bacterium]